ncbi:hypothetical protein SAMN05421858_0622 [Haladaptatus litoreus]|uniref:Uncharacterized protein n=1 Tax=Haladaptatus litoreus TaxID=553468 RepID=A0A1N6W7D6_9EURY|nr:hypothetical protein [Haladaptatus litoreus]SIQ85855.1 hypothetical protein SAMN05421858_0622 [Haladaptatus litoreus]
MDNRGVSPVIGKVLEAGLVVLYIGMITTTLYGGVVPEYRTAVGDEVSDRVLSKAAERIQQAVPANGTAVRGQMRVTLPRTIRGTAYEIHAENRTLTLVHSNEQVSEATHIAVPEHVGTIRGTWSSTEPAVIVVRSGETEGAGLVVELKRGQRERAP